MVSYSPNHQKNMIYSICSVVRRERFFELLQLEMSGWSREASLLLVGGLLLLKGPGFWDHQLTGTMEFLPSFAHMIRSRSSKMNAKKYPALAEENLVISIWFHMCFLTSAQWLSTHGFPQVFSCFFYRNHKPAQPECGCLLHRFRKVNKANSNWKSFFPAIRTDSVLNLVLPGRLGLQMWKFENLDLLSQWFGYIWFIFPGSLSKSKQNLFKFDTWMILGSALSCTVPQFDWRGASTGLEGNWGGATTQSKNMFVDGPVEHHQHSKPKWWNIMEYTLW